MGIEDWNREQVTPGTHPDTVDEVIQRGVPETPEPNVEQIAKEITRLEGLAQSTKDAEQIKKINGAIAELIREDGGAEAIQMLNEASRAKGVVGLAAVMRANEERGAMVAMLEKQPLTAERIKALRGLNDDKLTTLLDSLELHRGYREESGARTFDESNKFNELEDAVNAQLAEKLEKMRQNKG